MEKIGYARVSTKDQKLDLQRDALREAGVDRLFEEKVSGAKSDRPALRDMLQYVRRDDTVIVWKLDRIGRSMKDLFTIVSSLEERGVHFVSLKENLDTSHATGKLIFHLFASLAEFERDMLSERTKAGLRAAKERGKPAGRPPIEEKTIDMAIKMYESGNFSTQEILRVTHMAKATFYRYLAQRS